MPEWTSNVVYYSKSEFVRVNHAPEFHVRGSLVVPSLIPMITLAVQFLRFSPPLRRPILIGKWIVFGVLFQACFLFRRLN